MPNVLSKEAFKLTDVEKRKFDIIYAGFSLETMPKNVSIKNKFGEFETQYKQDAENIMLYRRYERSAGRFPSSDYQELAGFYNDMFKADHARLVFVKKEGYHFSAGWFYRITAVSLIFFWGIKHWFFMKHRCVTPLYLHIFMAAGRQARTLHISLI